MQGVVKMTNPYAVSYWREIVVVYLDQSTALTPIVHDLGFSVHRYRSSMLMSRDTGYVSMCQGTLATEVLFFFFWIRG
jgi:hypothetical protein